MNEELLNKIAALIHELRLKTHSTNFRNPKGVWECRLVNALIDAEGAAQELYKEEQERLHPDDE